MSNEEFSNHVTLITDLLLYKDKLEQAAFPAVISVAALFARLPLEAAVTPCVQAVCIYRANMHPC